MAWEGGSPLLFPVPCGAMTVVGVSTLPLKEVNAYQEVNRVVENNIKTRRKTGEKENSVVDA